ncbi:MAG: SDR family oxidoreductase [Chloroflexi bacterium]|nr:SDR family oxidoreductase [Chloroflexota bacterium]
MPLIGNDRGRWSRGEQVKNLLDLSGKTILITGGCGAIAPGIVAVGMAKRQWDHEPPYRARAEKAIPQGYLQPAASVAQAFLFLCSAMADYMTGSVLLVDGGCSLYPMD